MKRWLASVWCLAGLVLAALPAGAATHTVRDNFNAVSFGNNDGSTTWAGSWTEVGDDGSPSTGGIVIVASGTNDLNTLRMQGPTSGTTLTTRSIRRTVNLTGATAAFWSFSFGTRSTFDATVNQDRLRFRISNDGGTTFADLETISGTAMNNIGATRLFDITPYIASNTTIEFEIRANATDEQAFFDNVQVLWVTPDSPPAVTPGVYQGLVFQDYNANGFRDVAAARPAAGFGDTRLAIDRGVAGVTVTLYDSAGVNRGSAVTDLNGAFSVTPTGTGPYRLEYTTLPAGYRPGPVGTHNASTVRFVPAGGASGLDLGINVPREFATDNPNMLAICYVFGDQINGQWRTEPVLVNFPYNAGSTRTTPNIIPPLAGQPAVPAVNRTIINNEFSNPTTHSTMVLANQIGTTYGMAYSRLRGRAYAAAFFKRHAGFGRGADGMKWTADDPGAIYVVDPVTSSVTGVFTVPGVTVNAHDFAGHIPGPTPPDYDQSYIADGGNVAWEGVGTTSLGGMDINEEETRLYVMDLQNRRLVMLDAVTGAFLGAATVPTPPGIAPADVRPFGVKIHRGVGYITITGSAASTPTVDTFTDVDNDGLYRGPETFWDENQNGVFDAGDELFDRNGNGLLDAGEPFVDNDGNGVYNEGDASQLKGFLYTFDLATLAFGSSPIFEIDLRYERIYGRDHLGATGHWRPWRDTFRAIPREQFDTTFEWSRYPIYPQPWFKGVEFDNNGDLILAIADRYGHQIGSDAPDNPDLPFKLYNAATVGDLLKAGWNGTSWVLESGARVTNLSGTHGVGPTANRMGPGGGEFYFNDHYSVWHPETAMGAIIQVPGYPEVMTAIFDPNWIFRNGDSGTAFDGGFAWYDNTTGERRRNYRLYDGNAGYPTFGKASGLGGLVIQTRAAYLELGNRVWSDTNKNGVQDPGEPVFAGVLISLFRPGFGPNGIAGDGDDNDPISTVTTDANGNYLFSNDDRKTDTSSADYGMNLLYNTDYVIGIRDSNFSGVLTGFVPTTANAAGISNDAVLDVNDSDAVLVNAGTGASFSTYGVALNTGNQGYNNHSYDFGFVGPVVGLGNLVFKDRNANGRFDSGDTRVPGVRVELWTAGPNGIPGDGDDVLISATTTDGDGRYLFQTTPGIYYVKVPASEFQAGKPLDGFVSSTGHGGDDGKDDSGATVGAAGDENGIDDPSPAVNGIRTVLITLSVGGEPTNGTGPFPASESGDDFNRDNLFPGSLDSSFDLTIDFGFVAPGLGNLVWLDNGAGGGIAGNGIRDGTEPGIPGVTVQLWRDNGDSIFNTGTDTLVGTEITDANGLYYFAAASGNYFVHIPASNFTGPLSGLVSSPGHGGDTGKDDSGSLVGAAGDENGVDSPNPLSTGITSVLIALAPGTEPVDGTDAFPNSESGTDAGFDTLLGDNSNDLTIDFAFVAPSALLGIGNLVFLDYDGNSYFSPGDGRAANVRVELWANGPDGNPGTGDDVFISATVTDANGRYFFNAVAGQYNVRIPAAEFQAGGPLFGYLSSPGAGGDSGKDDSGSTVGVPGDENGIDDPNPAVNGIRSGTISLAATTEPVDGNVAYPSSESGDDAASDNARDSNVDLTVDFGFIGVGVGNLVWLDNGAGGGVAGNGIRDGTEAGVPNVTVQLWRDDGDGVFNTGTDTLVTSQVTDANGRYLFFTAPGNYFVALPSGNFTGLGPLAGLVSSPGHGGDSGKDDSGSTVGLAGDENGVDVPNLTLTGTSSVLINLAAGAEPVNGNVAFPNSESGTANTSDDGYGDDRVDLTVDFAFLPPSQLVGVGNLVFRDNNANGRFDGGDDRIANVLVRLFRDDGDGSFDITLDTLVASQFTDANGRYLFHALPGDYFVHVAGNNFLVGGPLHQHVSTPGHGGDIQKDDSGSTVGVAGDENGVDDPFPTVNGITSVKITLAAAGEPVNGTGAAPNSESGDNATSDDAFGDSNYDLTVDFGFIPANQLVGVGNLVFLDNNADGQYGAGDAPRANVLVQLWRNPNGIIGDGDDVLVSSQFTDAIGIYLFHTTPGQYYVKVPASEFQPGGPLAGYWSSPGVGSDNGRDQSQNGTTFNGDENGIDNANPEINGITTHNFILSAGNEPTNGNSATLPNTERVYLPGIDDAFGDSNYDMTIDLGFFPASGLGNLVFLDNNANGKFDAGDNPVPNVLLELRLDDGDGVFNPALDGVVRTTTTDANGRYRFLAPPGNYFVHIPASQFGAGGPLVGRFSSPGFGGDNGLDDNQDENGVDQPVPSVTGITSVRITLNPGSEPVDAGTETGDDAGADNLWGALNADNRFDWTIDFGFVNSIQLVSLGSTVFRDDNANGLQDGVEPGIPNVFLELLRPGVGPDGVPGNADDNLPVASLTTDANGNYHFTNLLPGNYQVRIPATNFNPGGPLYATPLSSPVTSTSDDGVDGDDNGTQAAPFLVTISPLINLTPGSEPLGNGTTGQENRQGGGQDDNAPFVDGNGDMTVDFGFVPSTAILGVGNLVFLDNDLDGSFSAGDTRVPGVSVQLYTSGNVLVDTTTTDASGRYRFLVFTPGDYYVQIPASQFQAGGPLDGYLSTPGAGDANDGTDDSGGSPTPGDENGIDSGSPAVTGIRSGVFNLNFNQEPVDPPGTETGDDRTSDNALVDGNFDLTIDFGFVLPTSLVGVGNLVFTDENVNGVFDPGTDTRVPGVRVELWRDDGDGIFDEIMDTFIASTLTDGSGRYLLHGVPGNYFVRIPPSEFQAGRPLENRLSVSGHGGDTGVDDQADENGVDDPNPAANGINSVLIALAAGTEPVDSPGTELGDAAASDNPLGDGNYDLTVDFGFVPPLDFGDLPDTGTGTGPGNYQTLLSDSGPWHKLGGGLVLGTVVDAENDGQPNGTATGDDINGVPDDEDGVTIPTLQLLATANIQIVSSGAGVVNAFIDWNNNGILNDAGETYTLSVVAGVNNLSVTVPLSAYTGGPIGARFRLSSAGGLGPTGGAPDGEVEDYLVQVNTIPTASSVTDFSVRAMEGGSVVSWKTGFESGTVGFRLFRQAEEGGPWTEVSSGLIPAVRGPAGGLYEVRLPGIPAGVAASYRIESCDETGCSQPHGPFQVGASPAASLAEGIRQRLGLISPGRPAPVINPAALAEVASAPLNPAKVPATEAAPAPVRPATPNRAPYALARVNAAGVYFVAAADLAAATGRTAAEFVELIQTDALGLAQDGVAVAHLPADDGSGLFFYSPAPQSLYSTERVFWLTGLRSLPMAEVDGGTPAAPGNTWHRHVQRHELNQQMVLTLSSNPEEDTWMWNSVLSGSPALSRRTYSFATTGLQPAAGNGTATLKARLFASDTGSRRIRAEISNSTGTHAVGEVTWAGKLPAVLEVSFDAAKLVSGGNQLVIRAEVPEGADPNSLVYMDWFEVTYPATAVAASGQAAIQTDAAGIQSVGGFASDQIGVLDVTSPQRPRVVVNTVVVPDGAGKHRVSFQAGSQRRYVAFDAAAARTPRSLEAAGHPMLSLQRTRASLVIIAHPSLLEAVQPLAEYRRQQGLEVKLVSLTDVANEFDLGQATPRALQRFLQASWERWRTRPAYVLLVGDGSYDYRNLLGKGDNLVPPKLVATQFGLYASDSVYGDVNGDGRREMAIGRLPATTPQQVTDFIAKLKAYEAAVPTAGGEALLVADAVDAGGDFVADSEAIRSLLEPAYHTGTAYRDVLGTAAAVRTKVLEAFSGDLDVFSYSGHGSHAQFGGTAYLSVADVPTLGTPGRRLPLVTAMTCVAGNFAVPGSDPLAEHLVLVPERGAVAVWAPSGLSLNDHAQLLKRGFVRRLTGAPAGTRLGDLVKGAAEEYHTRHGHTEFLDIYNLIGDPTTVVRR